MYKYGPNGGFSTPTTGTARKPMHKLRSTHVHNVLLRLCWLLMCLLRPLGIHAICHSGHAQSYCGFLAGSDAAGSAVINPSRALFVQGAKPRLSKGKRGSFSNSCVFFASLQDRVRLTSCDLHLSKVPVWLQAHRVIRSKLRNMHSLVLRGYTSNMKVYGHVHLPVSGDLCRGSSTIFCDSIHFLRLI